MSARRSWMLLPAQAAAAIACLALLMAWPPASGRMMLVPLNGGGEPGSTAGPAFAAGALLLGSGPIAGSVVVIGERSRIAAAAMSRGILVTAAPPSGCGADAGESRA